MKKIVKDNLLYIKIITPLMLILITAYFSVYPTSNAKYIKKESVALSYDRTFFELYKSGLTNSITLLDKESTLDNIKISVKFNRNNVLLENKKDTYTINLATNLKDVCSITLSQSNASPKGTISSNKISFEKNGTASIEAQIVCPISNTIVKDSSNVEYINIPIEIKEKISSDISNFTYMDGQYNIKLSDYMNKHLEPSTIFNIDVKAQSIYDDLIYYLTYSYFPYYLTEYENLNLELIKQSILKYVEVIKPVDESEDKKAFLDNLNLPGVSIDTTNPDYYVFKIENNFVGYARTYSHFLNGGNKYMYFSSSNTVLEGQETPLDYNSIFNYYINTYFYPREENAANREIINNYMQDKDIRSFIINGTPDIVGILRINENQIDISNLLRHATNSIKTPIVIEFGLENNMLSNFLTIIENNYYKKDIISLAVYSKIEINNDIYYSIIKNNDGIDINHPNNEPKQAFNDYFLLYDAEKEQYVILNIFADSQMIEEKYNGANLIVIPKYEALTITYESVASDLENPEAKKDRINVNISYDNLTVDRLEIIEVIKELDTYFGANSFVTNEELEQLVDNAISTNSPISYQINQTITYIE